jgi:ADP-ribosylglycohydrolase
MAVAIVDVPEHYGEIDEDALTRAFAARYRLDPYRGYGPGTRIVLGAIGAGASWRDASLTAFGGDGSRGNGSAMRVAPLGAYYADDLSLAVEEARRSAVVTHAHPVARHVRDYAGSLWATVSVPGDRDTNCAIVGGVVAGATGLGEIPGEWLSAREPLRRGCK